LLDLNHLSRNGFDPYLKNQLVVSALDFLSRLNLGAGIFCRPRIGFGVFTASLICEEIGGESVDIFFPLKDNGNPLKIGETELVGFLLYVAREDEIVSLIFLLSVLARARCD